MYWYNSALPILRSLINDFDATDYVDARLLTILVHSAYLVQQELDLKYTYTINIEQETITPDPYTDTDFINLILFRSHYMIACGEYRKSADQAIRITDGPSMIDLSSQANSKKAVMQAAKDKYDSAILQYQMGVNNAGTSILSPYTQDNQWTR